MLAPCTTDDAALARPEVEKTKIDLRIFCGDFQGLEGIDFVTWCNQPLGVVSFDHDIDVDKIGLSEVDDTQEQEEIM
ncbi:hypothetical protein RHGRI_016483 [Rhododendron griersonianum]|uniref:Uncharacterized protein n=1 Tax=Rhododendron griersonianum TaxID=479676 RepID=A0AAV6JUB9_9ERIC|nr:hypothetical protein RHGRI_016483 [Rhododendron griersonianum]